MLKRIALCLDEESQRYPDSIGLQGEDLDAQRWVEVFATGEQAREAIKADDVYEEAWVVSCDDVDPINLAATLKADKPDMCVRLVDFERGGSMLSRAHSAGIDDVMDPAALVRRYSEKKAAMPNAELQESQKPKAVPAHAAVKSLNSAFLMPVVSGSGGAGKSAVSTMGALIAKTMGYRTLLLDYDLQFGDVAAMCGIESSLAIDIALSDSEKLDQEIRNNKGFMVLSAPARLETAESVIGAIPDLVSRLSGSFDLIVANTGAAWADQHAVLLERSSAALFLVDQRASSLWACRHALELCARCGIATGQFQFVLNRCSKGASLTSMDVSAALDGVPVRELADGGRDVEDCLGGGMAQELLTSGNEFCVSLERLLADVLPDSLARQGEDSIARKSTRHRGLIGGRKRGRKS